MTNETALKPDLFTLTKSNLVVQYWSEGVLSIKLYKPLPQPRVYVHIVCVADVIQQIQSRLETSDYTTSLVASVVHRISIWPAPPSGQYLITEVSNRNICWPMLLTGNPTEMG